MNRFHPTTDKSLELNHVVSYHGKVPLERGLCYCLYLVEKHGLTSSPLSGSRDVEDINTHNREFGTMLHAQQYLIDMHRLHPAEYAPANPVDETSHCLYSDGNLVYRVPKHGRLPWYMRGIDLFNSGQAAHFCVVAGSVGLKFARPYHSEAEGHHVVCVENPTAALIARNVIHRR